MQMQAGAARLYDLIDCNECNTVELVYWGHLESLFLSR